MTLQQFRPEIQDLLLHRGDTQGAYALPDGDIRSSSTVDA
jgi:hypothetical protein